MSANKSREKLETVQLRVSLAVAELAKKIGNDGIIAILEADINNRIAEKILAMRPEQPKKPLLQRANELIGGARRADYGTSWLQNYSQLAMLWQGTLARKLGVGVKLSAEDVILCMEQVKIARLTHDPDHADSLLDIAGYAGGYEAIQNERAAGWKLQGATVDSRAVPAYPVGNENIARRPSTVYGAGQNNVGSGLSIDKFTQSMPKQDVTKISR